MIYWELFLAFLIPGILGYGGGPASIPLVENEVVDRYGWYTVQQFSEIVALGNSLPGPIATKMAGYIGYDIAGILGSLVALFAAVAPSIILMIGMLAILLRYKESPKVKRLSSYVRPVIAVLLGIMTLDFFATSERDLGIWQTIGIGVAAYLLMERFKVHPAFVIGLALVYGGVFLA